MYPTAEVRWFLEGAPPPEVKRWFRRAVGEAAAEARTDRYVGTEAEDLGVKVRQGRLEVKRRAAVADEVRWGAQVSGGVETWRKWSFGLDGGVRPSEWIAVGKERRLVTFRVKNKTIRQAARVGGRAHGVGVELAEVAVGDRRWWSLCLEAFGPGEAMRLRALHAVAAHVFADAPPVLPRAASMGYPAWLRAVAGRA